MEPQGLPLPDLLKHLRTTAKMSQRQLAEKLCAMTGTFTLTRFEVGRWEQGRVRPTTWLPVLAEALNVSLETLENAPDRPGKKGTAIHPTPEDSIDQVGEVLRRTFLQRSLTTAAVSAMGLNEELRVIQALNIVAPRTSAAWWTA
ncbi:helix-turn-helix domain-containing protein [Nonomuraea endophytica]|uniref:helix-turn-helix domain-containing protein n=1 Tax=Nonomuraea endophytica TaxID=714136 RepID=UPI0037C831BC